jgi:hypothetical protein
MRQPRSYAASLVVWLVSACIGCSAASVSGPRSTGAAGGAEVRRAPNAPVEAVTTHTPTPTAANVVLATLLKQRPSNFIAYIPPQCYAKTLRPGSEAARNPCYVCHRRAEPPNFVSDGDLQVTLTLPRAAAQNPWTNLFRSSPIPGRQSDDDVLEYVRRSNYFDDRHEIVLAKALETPAADWDIDGNGVWNGYRPDVWFAFDDRGFDHRPDGSPTGWRAFAYYPFPGEFFPTNGSADDALIRLAPDFQQDREGHFDQRIYEINLAIVESLIIRADVAIDAVDESMLGVDLDLDGRLGRATRVAFSSSRNAEGLMRMHYVGRARDAQDAGRLAMAPGLFPVGTEFFHTVRYLDVGVGGVVGMGARMKEVRYAKKTSYLGYDALRGKAAADARERAETPDGAHHVHWLKEAGIDNGQGWTFQGFIEDAQGALRPQFREETMFCAGCHGGIGATTDSIFSFARKLGDRADARGWFHWSRHGLSGIAEPKRANGQYEYSLYLRETGSGDDFGENAEVVDRFFDERHQLRPSELRLLHGDMSRLLLPSAARALDLDRAYLAVVRGQSFVRGRGALTGATQNAYPEPPLGKPTGVHIAVAGGPLLR